MPTVRKKAMPRAISMRLAAGRGVAPLMVAELYPRLRVASGGGGVQRRTDCGSVQIQEVKPVPIHADQGRVSPRVKRILWWAIYPTLAWSIAIFIVAFVFGYFKDGDHETLRDVVVAISVPVVLAHAAAGIYALVWVIRKLGGRNRLAWIAALWIGGSLGVMAWWWEFVRPLPEPR
jgi:hypothetical protein